MLVLFEFDTFSACTRLLQYMPAPVATLVSQTHTQRQVIIRERCRTLFLSCLHGNFLQYIHTWYLPRFRGFQHVLSPYSFCGILTEALLQCAGVRPLESIQRSRDQKIPSYPITATNTATNTIQNIAVLSLVQGQWLRAAQMAAALILHPPLPIA